MQEYEGCKRCGKIGRTLAGFITINGKTYTYSGCWECYGSRDNIERAARIHHGHQSQGAGRTPM